MIQKKKLVVIISNGLDNERSSVAWSIANAGVNTGLEVTVFLVSSGVDWARKGAKEIIQLNPNDPPVKDFMQNVLDTGNRICVCPPCAKLRGYEEEDLIEGAVITGPDAIYGPVCEGAATLTF